jgi:hypothetical protein
MLQYNKLYQSLKKVSAEWHAGNVLWDYSWEYLKFYEDGTVIYASIQGEDIEQINQWFNQSAEYVSKGKYTFISRTQLNIYFESNKEILMGFSNDGKLLMQGNLSWDIFTPIG